MNRLSSFLSGINEPSLQDVFFFTGKPIISRIGNTLRKVDKDPISHQELQEMVEEMTDEQQRMVIDRHGEVDVSYHVSTGQRFRVNIFKRLGKLSMVLRYIKDNIPSFKELCLPEDGMVKIASFRRGLVIICGVAGSGKSTTVAAIINYMNQNFERHIISIEDPIEYLFYDNKSVITQREIGIDTLSYELALKHIVRQSPDVIYIGELRDKVTMESALHAAETGHLVISTLHTKNAVQTIDRIANFFYEHERRYLNTQLSAILQAIVAQRLIPMKDDQKKRVPACEILFNTPTVRELIEEGKYQEISRMVKESKIEHCRSFNDSLIELIDSGMVDKEIAVEYSDSPEELRLSLRGITQKAV